MKSNTFKVVSFNILVLAGIVIGLFYHLIQPIFLNDLSKISYLIALLMAYNVCLSVIDCVRPTSWISGFMRYGEKDFLYLGLTGTLIGFTYLISIIFHAISGSGGGGQEVVNNVMRGFATGMQTSFNATLVGLVAYMWTRRLLYLKRV